MGLLVKYTLTQDYWMALEAEHGISNTLNKNFFYHYTIKDICLLHNWCFPGVSVVKNWPANAGDAGLIPGWG